MRRITSHLVLGPVKKPALLCCPAALLGLSFSSSNPRTNFFARCRHSSIRSTRVLCLTLLVFVVCILTIDAEQAGLTSDGAFSHTNTSERPSNARSCVECHSTPGLGGSSRRTVMRAGFIINGKYVGVPNGGILHTLNYRASSEAATIFGPRVTLNLLGDGYVEAVSAREFQRIAREQILITEGKVHGEIVYLASREKSSVAKAVGRFGWKAQHASLMDASADALLNEIGIPNRIFLYDASEQEELAQVPHRTTPANELDAIVKFVRSTEPSKPDPARSVTEGAKEGSEIFDRIGCSVCHVRTLRTAPTGTRLVGSDMVVSKRLGNKKIHPYGDYLLHDIGTGDAIVQSVRPEDYSQSTANKFRTAPLWGLRFRLWMMHDGRSLTYHQAIMRHRGEALGVTLKYSELSLPEKEELRQFLDSL